MFRRLIATERDWWATIMSWTGAQAGEGGPPSGIGAATARRLDTRGHRAITVDRRDADVTGDVGTEENADNTQRSGGGP